MIMKIFCGAAAVGVALREMMGHQVQALALKSGAGPTTTPAVRGARVQEADQDEEHDVDASRRCLMGKKVEKRAPMRGVVAASALLLLLSSIPPDVCFLFQTKEKSEIFFIIKTFQHQNVNFEKE